VRRCDTGPTIFAPDPRLMARPLPFPGGDRLAASARRSPPGGV